MKKKRKKMEKVDISFAFTRYENEIWNEIETDSVT